MYKLKKLSDKFIAWSLMAAMMAGNCVASGTTSFAESNVDKIVDNEDISNYNENEYTYLYASLTWAEYWQEENIYLEDGKELSDKSDKTDSREEYDKGAFDAVTRATTNHGLHRGSYQSETVINADNGKQYTVSYWDADGKSFYENDGTKIGYSRGTLTLPDGTTTKLVDYNVIGIKYVPVAVKTSELEDFCSKYNVVKNGESLVGGYSEKNLKAYNLIADVTPATNGLKIAYKNRNGNYSFGKRTIGTDSGIKNEPLKNAAGTVNTIKTGGSYGEFLRMDIGSAETAGEGEGYGPLGSMMQTVKWTYYGNDSTYSNVAAEYGTKFAADNWMHKAMGIQLGLTDSYRAKLPEGMDGSGYWRVTVYGLGYADASYDINVTADQIAKHVETDDISALNNLIEKAKSLNAAEYTESSWKNLLTELGEAEDEVAKNTHYEAIVNEACIHLQEAIDSLEKMQGVPEATKAPKATQAPETKKTPNQLQTSASSTESTAVQNDVKLKKAVISKVKAKKKSVTVSWKKVSGATAYEIQYSTKKNMKKAIKFKVKANNGATIKKLKSKKIYYIRVRAIASKGEKNIRASWSKIKKVKVK